jgi:hypothetical protein
MKSREPMFTAIVSRIAMAALFFAPASPLLRAADMKPEDVVARHLDAIGTVAARAAAKSRIVQGTAQFKMRVGGSGNLQGTSALVSEGRKSVLMIKLANNDYYGEQFVTDGNKVSVSATTSNHRWSDFGEFVRSHDQIVLEGLLGGELTTAWALLNLAENKAKLNYDGEKKVDGRPAYQLTYHSKKRDDLTIRLYFDAETYRHVLTTYSITLASGLGGFAPSISDQAGLTSPSNAPGADVTQSAKQKEIRYTIEEEFSDFKTAEGLTLPAKYVIHFTSELQNGTTNMYQWDVAADEVSNNKPLDPRNFQVK